MPTRPARARVHSASCWRWCKRPLAAPFALLYFVQAAPPDHLRLSVLATTPASPQRARLDYSLMSRADAEMALVIDHHRTAFAEQIKRSWCY